MDKLSGYHCIDTVTGATALAELKNSGFTADSIPVKNLFIGNIHGTIGETSAIAILIGAVILLAFKVIDFKVPLTYIGSFEAAFVTFTCSARMGFRHKLPAQPSFEAV